MSTRTRTKRALGSRLIAVLTALMGGVNLLSATVPAIRERVQLLRLALPLEVLHGARLASALAGFALLLVAVGLWRRKRMAWGLTLLLLLVTAFTHLVKGLDWEEAAGATVLACLLLALRGVFTARSDTPSVQHGIRVTAVALLFTLAYGVTGFFLLDRHFKEDFGFIAAVEQTVAMFVSFSDPGLEPVTHFGRWFADSIYLVAAGTLGYSLIALLRPVLHERGVGGLARTRAAGIIADHGRSSLARFNLFDDKSYLFTPGGSVVSFGVSGRVCVALGDPIGPTNDLPAAIAAFRAQCEQNDWTPAFFQTLPDLLPAYQQAGFGVLPVGSEAVVDLEAFTLSGKAYKSLRGNVNRLQRDGCTGAILQPPHAHEVMRELRAISDEWMTEQKGAEKRFSLGWHDDAYLQDGPLAVVKDAEGTILAFANIIPEYQAPESTVDLMRKRTDAPSGTMDLLFVTLFEWAKAQGFRTFNLGLSPLAGVGDAPDDPAIEKAVAFLREHFRQFYPFDGLREFKEKFRPRWEPRYLVYTHAAALPRVALAIIRLDNGDEPLWRYVFPANTAADRRERDLPNRSTPDIAVT